MSDHLIARCGAPACVPAPQPGLAPQCDRICEPGSEVAEQRLSMVRARIESDQRRLASRLKRDCVTKAKGTSAIGVVVIAASTGGPSALEKMLPMLPFDLDVPVLIVQHMPKLFTGPLTVRLRNLCALPVHEAQNGDTIWPGGIWIAPGDAHLELVHGLGGYPPRLRLHREASPNGCMPSADYLFRSVARVYGTRAMALVMTGMGSDGLDGARAIREAGGTVMAQDEATSAVWGMPARVVEAGLAQGTVSLEMMASEIVRRVRSDPPALFGTDHPAWEENDGRL